MTSPQRTPQMSFCLRSRRLLAVATVATTLALSQASVPVPSEEALVAAADSAASELLHYFDATTGFFGPTDVVPFWTTANAVETLSNYIALTNKTQTILPVLDDVYEKAFARYCNCFRDDHLWYVNAWARLFEVTRDERFLATSQAIYYNITANWHSWNTTCGGMNWENGNPYVNSITNELFLTASAYLWQLTGNITKQGNFSYPGWAKVEWSWWQGTPLMTSDGLIIDGLDQSDCKNTTGAYWTYNQGVILSGLARYSYLFRDSNALSYATSLAQAAIRYFGAGTPTGDVLVETSCGAVGMCGGLDVQQFKGVFIRHLTYALPTIAKANPAAAQFLEDVILHNAASIIANASQTDPTTGFLQLGPLWQGPFQPPGGQPNQFPFVAQGAGLDAILAALQVQRARRGRV
jgi:predicted alpha-1,6-mannanase (GH76 family)